MPTKIEARVLDPITEERHIETIDVSYPFKPLVCTACKSLGHLVGACPNVTRKWVKKQPREEINAGKDEVENVGKSDVEKNQEGSLK